MKLMLINYMLKVKTIKNQDYVSILFKLCAESRAEILCKGEFFTQLPLNICFQNIQILRDFKRFHSVALLNNLMNQNEEAFQIWKE